VSGPAIVNLGDAFPFPAVTEGRRAGHSTWFETTQEQREHFRDVLPPIPFPGGFFVSEPAAYDGRGVPIYSAFVKLQGRYFVREFAADAHEAAFRELVNALKAEEDELPSPAPEVRRG